MSVLPATRRGLPLAALLVALSATAAPADTVVVFAAASLRDALDEVVAGWEAETGHDAVVSYAGSGLLARQIIAGAPADLYLSASEQWMDAVEAEGLLAEGTRRDLLGNALVLISHDPAEPGPVPDIAAALGDGRLAMGMVDSVPAGQYGKAALQSLGQWEAVEPLVAQADNVRAALALVATGEAPLGIVYATDAAAEPAVHVLATFPEGSHAPIRYPLALTAEAADAADRALYDALAGDTARAIFARHGFSLP